MKYKVTVDMEIDSDDYIKSPKSIKEVRDLFNDMVRGLYDWHEVKLKVTSLVAHRKVTSLKAHRKLDKK